MGILFLPYLLINSFFSTSQANPKYLPCISICCLFLAVKMCEEDEVLTSMQSS